MATERHEGFKFLNPVPSDSRFKVSTVDSVRNDPTYYVGFTPVQEESTGKVFKVSSGNAVDGWVFTELYTNPTSESLSDNEVTLSIDEVWRKLSTLDTIQFDWSEEANSVFGLSGTGYKLDYEQVKAEFPDICSESDYKYIDYSKLMPILIQAMVDLNSRI